jgi:hypothetical protein
VRKWIARSHAPLSPLKGKTKTLGHAPSVFIFTISARYSNMGPPLRNCIFNLSSEISAPNTTRFCGYLSILPLLIMIVSRSVAHER